MAAPTFVASALVEASGNLTVTVPATAQVGDTLVAVSSHTTQQPTPPAGWTQQVSRSQADFANGRIWTRTVQSGDPGASVTFTATTSGVGSLLLLVYRGVDSIGAVASASGGDTYVDTEQVTIAADTYSLVVAALVVGAGGYNVTDDTVTLPSGWTTRADDGHTASNQPFLRYAVVDRVPSAAGDLTATFDHQPNASPTTTSADWVTLAIALSTNAAPNAPIPTSPADGSTVNRANPIELKATFSDPDTGDSPSASKWRYRIVGAAAWMTVEQGNTLQSYTIPAGLTAGDYEWQAAYADQLGKWGPFCSSSFFTAADPPPGPTWLDPVDGQTITSASHTGQISIASLDKSEWTLYVDNAGVIDTTTVVQGPLLKTTGDLRSHTFTGLANNTPVWWSVRIEDGGLWTTPVQIRTPVAFTPPPVPTLVVAKSDAEGLVSVAVTNPAGDPAAAYNDIYCRTAEHSAVTDAHRPFSVEGERLAAIKPVNSTFLDWLAASGVVYEYRAVAVAENGTTADSGWMPLDPAAEPTIHYGGGYGD